MIDDCTGAVLAGGQGTRLGGVRKALLTFPDGKTLIARSLGVLGGLFPQTIVIANEVAPYVLYGSPIVGDPIADRGAPGGLFGALSAAKTPWLFLAACDMPALDPRVIEAIARRREKARGAVVVTRDGRPEPLHAFWSTGILPALETLLKNGEPSFRDLLDAIPHWRIPIEELETEIPGAAKSFANVNSPEDLAAFGLSRPRA